MGSAQALHFSGCPDHPKSFGILSQDARGMINTRSKAGIYAFIIDKPFLQLIDLLRSIQKRYINLMYEHSLRIAI